jgi:hypothetical protein
LVKDISSRVYRVNPAIAIEDFDDRSLALHCVDLRLVELNTTARDLLSRLDGQSSLRQVAASVAKDYDRPSEAVLADVQVAIAQMVELDVVESTPSALEEATPT